MTSEIRVLIIDDEQTIRSTLRVSLKTAGYELAEAVDGKTGIKQTESFHPHVVLLDLGLPDMNGFEVLKEIRKWSRVPIIVLTANDDENTKVKLLDAGADDYLTKPFSSKELLARVRVVIRNIGVVEATPNFVSGDLEVDLTTRRVSVENREVKLTSTEFEVLSRLVRDHGRVVSQSQLLKQVWGHVAEDHSHYLRIYINQLRKKLEKNPSDPKHIITEPGVGYRLV